MKTNKQKTNLKRQRTDAMSQKNACKWYVIHGFNVDDETQTGFLGMNMTKEPNGPYKIVKTYDEALKFPSMNIYGIKGFGTPKQWLEFFKGEDELSNWKFNLLKIRAPMVNKEKHI